MEDNEEIIEESGVTFGQVLSVLFSRKLLILILTLATCFLWTLGAFIFKKATEEYVAGYSYYMIGLTDSEVELTKSDDGTQLNQWTYTYLDGSKFDYRSLITLEKLLQYQSEHEELKGLDMEEIYSEQKIVSLDFVEILKKNEAKVKTTDPDFVVDKTEYKIVLEKNAFSKEQAKVLVEAIAYEPLKENKRLAAEIGYNDYIELCDQAKTYENQIKYMQSQVELLNDKYEKLLDFYGDITLENGKKLSALKKGVWEYFQNYSLSALSDEAKACGYVKTYTTDDLNELKAEKSGLERTAAAYENKIDQLHTQVSRLITSANQTGMGLQQIDLASYNEQISALTVKLADIQEEIDLLDKKITATQTAINNQSQYKADAKGFLDRLQIRYGKIQSFTAEYAEAEAEVVEKASKVYFENNQVIDVQSDVSILMNAVLALACGFVLSLVVNFILDGKKLFETNGEKK